MPDTDKSTAVVTTDSAGTVTPPVNIVTIPWWKSALVRATRASLQTLTGSQIFTDLTGKGAFNVESLRIGLVIAAGTFITSFLHNTVDYLAGLDQSSPAYRG